MGSRRTGRVGTTAQGLILTLREVLTFGFVGDSESAGASDQVWKVGALAELTGLTVRALHHYDHIGLLVPSRRSASGHRLYDGTDVARLYRICVLRRLGFSLDQVADVLDDPQWQIKQTVQRHLEDTRRRAALVAELAARLSRMSNALNDVDLPTASELFATIEEMTMLESTVHSTTALLVYDDLPAAHDFPRLPATIRRNRDGRRNSVGCSSSCICLNSISVITTSVDAAT